MHCLLMSPTMLSPKLTCSLFWNVNSIDSSSHHCLVLMAVPWAAGSWSSSSLPSLISPSLDNYPHHDLHSFFSSVETESTSPSTSWVTFILVSPFPKITSAIFTCSIIFIGHLHHLLVLLTFLLHLPFAGSSPSLTYHCCCLFRPAAAILAVFVLQLLWRSLLCEPEANLAALLDHFSCCVDVECSHRQLEAVFASSLDQNQMPAPPSSSAMNFSFW